MLNQLCPDLKVLGNTPVKADETLVRRGNAKVVRKLRRSCGHQWFWHLSDGRFKCRSCGGRQSFASVWDSCRLSEAATGKLLECFVFGVPAYRLRFRGPASLPATERFFGLSRSLG